MDDEPKYKTIRSFALSPGKTTTPSDNERAADFDRELNEAAEAGYVPLWFCSTPVSGDVVHSVLLELKRHNKKAD